jgi:hypothetical protein
MNEFGKTLRKLRQRSNDPDNLDRRLSQERFGDLIGRQLGALQGYSDAIKIDDDNSVGLWPPSISDEPYYKLPRREQHLKGLLEILESAQGARIISIEGLGGLGKTALASELARRVVGYFG